VFDRGHKLSTGTLTDGVVEETPEQLGIQAAMVLGFVPDPNVLALARMGRSEGVDGMEYRMHVAINDLRYLQSVLGSGVYSSLLVLMTHSKVAAANGHFSAQRLGKRYSTAADPYEGDYQLAQKVLADDAQGVDPTGGARKFVDKSGPLYVDGQKATFDELAASWAGEGLRPVQLDGASDNFVVFVPA
jgi:hypothetical protein